MDLISRQAAIDAIVDCTVYGNADDLKEAVVQENAWNKWSGGVLEALEAVEELPSAQPDVIAHGEGELTEQEPCEDAVSREMIMRHYDSGEYKHVNHISRNGLLDYIEQLPSVTPKLAECDDAVSREAVFKICDRHDIKGAMQVGREVQKLPSVTPKPRTGEWIDDNCSECGFYVHHGDMRNFCPNCGAKMKGWKDE